MRIGSFVKDSLRRLGVFEQEKVIDANGSYQSYLADINAPDPDLQARVELPADLVLLLNNGPAGIEALRRAVDHASTNQDRRPGDVISAATPPAGPIAPGDIIEAEIEGIGILRNPVDTININPSFARLINLDQNAV
ncbi:MAG: hypothetical protein GY869_30855 [Planctomycetes bacterium]|nr:hypothetical protein [Planctomycetota bacterium]